MNPTIGEKTKLELSDDDARMFLMFRKFQDDFLILASAGVFDLRNGQAVINFDGFGICDVKLSTTPYKKR